MGRTHRRLGGSGAPRSQREPAPRAGTALFPTQRAAAAGAHGPAHAIRDRVPQLAETTKRRELLKVVAVSELRRVELLLE